MGALGDFPMSALNQPHFQDQIKAREWLEALLWPNGAICPHCASISKEHYALKGNGHRPGLWMCKDCREQFTVTVGTVFERSKIALHIWLQAVYYICSSKKGMSSHQLHRTLGVTYKTAWFMTHRIREAMRTGGGLLGGGGKPVEADETYYGKEPGREMNSRYGGKHGGGHHRNKIVALVDREGHARSFHVANIDANHLKPILLANIDRNTRVFTDTAGHYRKMHLKDEFKSHEMVNHSAFEYARGDVNTNTVESYFGLLKRGLYGTYHHVSHAHLQRYCDEFDFRFSHRTSLGVSDAQRATAALKQISGKRLTYRRISSAQSQD
jgi:transposase-like protein